MTRHHDIVVAGFIERDHRDNTSAIRSRDTGGRALASVDQRTNLLNRIAVVGGGQQRNTKLAKPLVGESYRNDAAPPARHEIDNVGPDVPSRHTNIARGVLAF